MNHKKVCHIITGLETGGAETQLLRILQSSSNSRLDPLIISLRTEGEIGSAIRSLGIPVYATQLTNWQQLPSTLNKIRRILKAFSPDLIQGWMYHGNAITALTPLIYRRRIPLAWNVRHSLHDLTKEQPSTQKLIRYSRYLSHRIDLIVYNSKVARVQHERIGFKSSQGVVIPNGFDLLNFKFDVESRTTVRAKLQIPERAPVVGQVARYHPIKNHQGFLEMATRLINTRPDTHFLMIGKDVTTRNQDLHAAAVRIPPDQLHMLGLQPDVRVFYSAMDVLCNPSWSEGFPNVLGEAMACSVPCVATNVGDSAFVLGDTGQIVDSGDSAGMADAVNHILTLPGSDRAELGRAVRQRMESCFSIESVCLKYLENYETLTGNN